MTSGKHLSYFKRHCYSFWAILACQTQHPSRNIPHCYTFASDVSGAPAQPSLTLKTLFNVNKTSRTAGSGVQGKTEAPHMGFLHAQVRTAATGPSPRHAVCYRQKGSRPRCTLVGSWWLITKFFETYWQGILRVSNIS